jgi:cyclopropane-fatty-acyl-phospholipid synthase
MRLVRPAAFFHRLGCNSKIGFGESYMVGDWTSSELADLLTPFAARLSVLIPPLLQRIGRRFAEARQPREERNTVAGSRENIHRHYDLSNELFATFLDETMSYSSAWFAGPAESLADAQRARSTASWTWRRVGRTRTCWRSARAGASWPRGRRSGARG